MDRRRFIGSISAAGGATLNAAISSPKETESVTYAIEGFTCVTCAVGLEVMLRGQKGVTRVQASYPERTVVIGFDGTVTSSKVLKGFIAHCGFSVVDGR